MSQSSDDEVDDDSGKEDKDDEGLNDFISIFILYAWCVNQLLWQNSFSYVLSIFGVQVHIFQYYIEKNC